MCGIILICRCIRSGLKALVLIYGFLTIDLCEKQYFFCQFLMHLKINLVCEKKGSEFKINWVKVPSN